MTETLPLFGSVVKETSDDHYTPAWLFETLGLDFEIDVASPVEPIPYIPAKRFYSINDNGLAQHWSGRVWMNPPYSNATPWVRKFMDHGCGVALVPAAKSAWFYELWDRADGAVPIHRAKQQFAGSKSISYPVVLFSFGVVETEALSNVGRVRV